MADESEKDQVTITPGGAATNELSEADLSKVSGGDESPKETVTFEYGSIHVQYIPQKPDGTLKP